MEFSDARLHSLESQNSPEASHEQRSQRYFSMDTIKDGLGTIRSLCFKSSSLPPPMEDTEFFSGLKSSDLFDLHGEHVLMNAETYCGLRDGNKECLEKLKRDITPMSCLRSSIQGDSILNLVMIRGHLEDVKSIISQCPCLLLEPNWKDQLPLHMAARSCRLDVVEALVATLTFVLAQVSEEEREFMNPYLIKDTNGNTPLHWALKSLHMKTASFLVKAHQQASFVANEDGKCPLYLAIEAKNEALVKEMLLVNDEPEGRQYLAHIALKSMSMSTEILDVILDKYPSLLDERDEEGRTCLSFAASIGNYKGVCNLLDRSTSYIFECNDDGSYPIHVAVEKGYYEVVKEILERCPQSRFLLNRKKQNFIHIAADIGEYRLLCKLRAYHYLADGQDADGNTPLHLATIKWRPRVVKWLARKSNLYIQNQSGLSPIDIAESNQRPIYIYRERLTLAVLEVKHNELYSHRKQLRMPVQTFVNKEFINALIVLAALVATVTFAAGFTFPGGYKDAPPPNKGGYKGAPPPDVGTAYQGGAVLADDSVFRVFMFCNCMAMYCSILAIMVFMWAQLGDHSSVNLALLLLYVSILFMGYGFACGILMTVWTSDWFGPALSILFALFLVVLILYPLPHILLHRSSINHLLLPWSIPVCAFS